MVRNQIGFESLERSRSTTNLDKAASRVLQALKDNADIFSTSVAHQTAVFNKRFGKSDLLLQQTGKETKTSIQAVSQRTGGFSDDRGQWLECAVSSIIVSLSFLGMNDRFERVVDAHADTLSWIFEFRPTSSQRWDTFTSWLEQEHGGAVYLVSGKAASGKSTLMRYIFENHWKLCKSDAWTHGGPLMIPMFYIWSTETVMQNSEIGLFRSLLHQMFSQNRSLVQEILPGLSPISNCRGLRSVALGAPGA